MSQKVVAKILGAMLFAVAGLASALAQAPSPYGPPISLENAKKAAAPALAEAAKNNWAMAVAIVDPAGNLVYFEKMDNTQQGSVNFSMDKARSAALFKRPTQVFQDSLAGGIPLLMDGKIVGAIGVSGATSAQDAQCAKAGADALK
jgi:uncharacterized protein GlcG (DUF336 family)